MSGPLTYEVNGEVITYDPDAYTDASEIYNQAAENANDIVNGFENSELYKQITKLYGEEQPEWLTPYLNGEVGGNLDWSFASDSGLESTLALIGDLVSEPVTLTLVPVIDTENFSSEYGKISDAIQLQAPLEMHSSIVIDDANPISINDSGIREGLESIRSTVASGTSTVINALSTLGDQVNSLGIRISQMKLYLDSGALVGGIIGQVDRGLYASAMNGLATGVSAYQPYISPNG